MCFNQVLSWGTVQTVSDITRPFFSFYWDLILNVITKSKSWLFCSCGEHFERKNLLITAQQSIIIIYWTCCSHMWHTDGSSINRAQSMKGIIAIFSSTQRCLTLSLTDILLTLYTITVNVTSEGHFRQTCSVVHWKVVSLSPPLSLPVLDNSISVSLS